MQNELKEPGLADALRPYYDKWRETINKESEVAEEDLPPEEPEEEEEREAGV
ncbi:hypothetical protein EST38_g12542 [Candolleomyces aberdarensis]|uniref:Uncharacterized protein n=1 Tax=Candolleomyces aberdarensis TaxID=2316362 RepID=A0A4Q2D263_9AGAR|nr:hypothetical protein EST38_g12542 [Candolleomyces aberdarensis]